MDILAASTDDFNARLVIGPMQVGALISAALFGCLAAQCYVYFRRFTSDHLGLKATVAALILIQLGHFVCVILSLWTMTVSNYGNPSLSSVLSVWTEVVILLTSFTTFIVQSFYAFRLWKLSRKVVLPILSEMISIVAQTSILILVSRAISMTNSWTFEDHQNLMIMLSFISRAVCDLTTTVGIAWNLKQKRDSGIKDTITIIDQLIIWTIETGLVTSLMAITVVVLILAMEQNDVWIAVALLWPNVVANSLLATLNRRLILRDNAMKGSSTGHHIGLSTLVIRVDATQTQPDPLESFKNRDVHAFKEAEHSIDQERTGSHTSMCSINQC